MASSIKVECPTCGQTYPVAASMAGLKLKCRNCGAVMVAPAQAVSPLERAPIEPETPAVEAPVETAGVVEESVAPVFEAPAMKEPGKRAFDVFHVGAAATNRRMASRLCLALAGIGYLSALVTVIMAFTVNGSNAEMILPPGTTGMFATILGISAVVFAGLGTTYLLCGLKMGGENFRTVMVAAIVGAVHGVVMLEVLWVLGTLGKWIEPVAAKALGFGLTLSGVSVICLGGMVYFAVRTLQVRR